VVRAPLAQRLLDALPQTQCTRCGYPDCEAYASAIAAGQAAVNRCPPGGAEGMARLAAIADVPCPTAIDAHCGTESPRTVAWIDENWCIGCTLCIKACPTDAIIGSHKRMHTVIEPYCTGCELCVPVCPVDCIQLDNVSGEATGWAAWSDEQANEARTRYAARQLRLARESVEHAARLEARAREKLADLQAHTHGAAGGTGGSTEESDGGAEAARKRAIIEAALARAAKARSGQR
jgi:Na+-translocating ferredoxin:NAD+ oxidoreductase subunit B